MQHQMCNTTSVEPTANEVIEGQMKPDECLSHESLPIQPSGKPVSEVAIHDNVVGNEIYISSKLPFAASANMLRTKLSNSDSETHLTLMALGQACPNLVSVVEMLRSTGSIEVLRKETAMERVRSVINGNPVNVARLIVEIKKSADFERTMNEPLTSEIWRGTQRPHEGGRNPRIAPRPQRDNRAVQGDFFNGLPRRGGFGPRGFQHRQGVTGPRGFQMRQFQQGQMSSSPAEAMQGRVPIARYHQGPYQRQQAEEQGQRA